MVSHVLIIAEENSQFSFIQHLNTKGDEANAAHCMVEVLSRANSHVHFSSVDELGEHTYSFLHRRANLSRNARFDWAIGIVNDQNTLGDITSELIGEGAHSESKVIAVTTGKQSNGINNRVVNRGKHTTANISQRGSLMGLGTLFTVLPVLTPNRKTGCWWCLIMRTAMLTPSC